MTQDYLIGTQLDEYRLDRLLGRGGMARVYRGVDVNLNRPVAIKVIDVPHRAEVEYVRRFKREAQAIARLDHPHIVRLYRYGEVATDPVGDRVLYMAMQYIQGATLEYVLESYRKDGEYLEAPEASRIIREICEALDYAHAIGIIHRDVKPSNVMLDSRGKAILTDFGLALFSAQATRGEIFGSPQYIAPEQAISSAKAVPQSDLYAVGVILYEMFTGALPFNAEEPLELALMQINNPPPSPRKLRPEISPELETVILRALEKRPEKRYPSGKALSVALDHALSRQHFSTPFSQRALLQRVESGITSASAPEGGEPRQTQGKEAAGTLTDLPGKETPLQPTSKAITTPTAIPTVVPPPPVHPGQPPKKKKRNPFFWIAGGVGGLLLLSVLCLVSNGWAYYNQIFLLPTLTPTALISQAASPTAAAVLIDPTDTPAPSPTPTATDVPPTLTPTSTPTITPEPTSTPIPYSFQIYRHGFDKAYLVIRNGGKTNLPLDGLSLRVQEGELPVSAWNVTQLKPGECLLSWNEEHKGGFLPDGVRCKYVGHTQTIKNSMGAVFTEDMDVLLQDEVIGTCGQGKSSCTISFSKPSQ